MSTGRCLCGTVRYAVDGPLRGVLICHCRECRRWHGHVCATTAAQRTDVRFTSGEECLRWVHSEHSEARARRGFCSRCGSSLFWDAPGRETISITAGTLDEPTGLRVIGHVHTAQAGDYYEPPPDQ